MSGKIITAIAAAVLLASTGLASAQTAPRHHKTTDDRYNGYYDVAPNGYGAPNQGADFDRNQYSPVTGQSWAG